MAFSLRGLYFRRAATPSAASLGGVGTFAQRRTSSERPSDDEVRKAYSVLGMNLHGASTAASLSAANVKRRFHELAKQHHPDAKPAAASNAGSSSPNASGATMAELNAAYGTLQLYLKGGGDPTTLLGRGHATPSDAGGGAAWGQQSAYWGPRDGAGNPFAGNPFADPFSGGNPYAHRGYSFTSTGGPMDMDAAYWEAFDGHGTGAVPGDGYHDGAPFTDDDIRDAWVKAGMYADMQEEARSAWRQRYTQAGSGTKKAAGNKKKSGKEQGGNAGEAKAEQPSKFTPVEQEALANMHRDGRSFDFIGNALGKSVPDVVEEFNRQSTRGTFEDKPRTSDQRQNRRGNRGGRGGGPQMSPEDMEEFFASPNFDPSMGGARVWVDGVPVDVGYVPLDDDGNPLFADFDADDGDEEDPTPFFGRPIHSHSAGRGGEHYNRGRKQDGGPKHAQHHHTPRHSNQQQRGRGRGRGDGRGRGRGDGRGRGHGGDGRPRTHHGRGGRSNPGGWNL